MAVDKLVDSTQLDADLTSVADAIRTKGGTSAQLAFPAGFVSAIGAIPTGGASTPYTLGGYYKFNTYELQVSGNHVKITGTSNSPSAMSVGLRQLVDTAVATTWFTINSGSTVKIEYKNVVNANSVIWNANLKEASSGTSLTYGIGNDAHLNGASVEATATATKNIGCLFLYITNTNADYKLTTGRVLEFDVEITVDGVRYV